MMKFVPFSPKQLRVLTWWRPRSPDCRRDAILCDGAVRSGKTLCLLLSFVMWATRCFSGMDFALCGKTILSLQRNLLEPLLPVLRGMGYPCRYQAGQRRLTVSLGAVSNRFILFGGRDAGSASLIQGITLAGVLLDEAALMPRSFVEQALARCSVPGSRYWFSCNPEHPFHWFYREWIEKAEEKNCLYLHFTMRDNPSLTPEIRRRYEGLYSGAFYRRFVLGEWCAPSGAVYPMFSVRDHVTDTLPAHLTDWYLSCDYGTVNPCSIGLWGYCPDDGVWYRTAEYYHDSRKTGIQRTDEEYYAALCALAGDRHIRGVAVDPSAASFMECIRRHGVYTVLPAQNDVLDGIRRVSELLRRRRLRFSAACRDTLREFSLYQWEENAREDRPRKENDHAMDEIRYFVSTVLSPPEKNRAPFCAAAVPRQLQQGMNRKEESEDWVF